VLIERIAVSSIGQQLTVHNPCLAKVTLFLKPNCSKNIMCNSFEKICIPLKICEDYFLLHKFFINCCITEDFNVLCVKKQGQILPQTDIEFPQMLCSANTSSPLSLPHQHGQNYP
jgi:hypothetical protein